MCGLKVRFTQSPERRGVFEYALKVEVVEANGISPKIFVYHQSPTGLDGNSFATFDHVAMPVDMQEIPEDAATSTVPWYRTNKCTVWLRAATDLSQAKQLFVDDILGLQKSYDVLSREEDFTSQSEVLFEGSGATIIKSVAMLGMGLACIFGHTYGAGFSGEHYDALDLDENPLIVTNVTFEGVVTENDIATTNAAGIVKFSELPPPMDGEASAGSAATAARSDHVHPAETEKIIVPQVPSSFFPITYYYRGMDYTVTAEDVDSGEFELRNYFDKYWSILYQGVNVADFNIDTLVYDGGSTVEGVLFNGVEPVKDVSPSLVAPGVYVRSVQVAKQSDLATKADKADIPTVSDTAKWNAAADREFLAISSDRSVALAQSSVESAFPYTTSHPASSASHAANGFSLNLKTYLDGFINNATITKVRLQSIVIRLRLYRGSAKISVVETGTSTVLALSDATTISNTGGSGADFTFNFSDGVWLPADKRYDFTLVDATSGDAIPASSIRMGFTNTPVIEGFEVLSNGNRSAHSGAFGRGMTVDYLALASINMAKQSDIPGTVSNVVTKAYVESLDIISEETDPVWTAEKSGYVQTNHTGSVRIAGSVAEGDNTDASGNFSHAEGNFTVATGRFSHAEGNETIASGNFSHAEGDNTLASGSASHAEGTSTTAGGNFSHAEGSETAASGRFSHAEGNFTVAANLSEHAQGRYNASHRASGSSWGNAGSTLSSTGFGMSDSTRRNAVETMQDGKTYIYGLGNYDGTNPTLAGVQDLASAINAKADAVRTMRLPPTGTTSDVWICDLDGTVLTWHSGWVCWTGTNTNNDVWTDGDGQIATTVAYSIYYYEQSSEPWFIDVMCSDIGQNATWPHGDDYYYGEYDTVATNNALTIHFDFDDGSHTNVTFVREGPLAQDSVVYTTELTSVSNAIPGTVSNVVTKAYVESLDIISEETDPVWTAEKSGYVQTNHTGSVRIAGSVAEGDFTVASGNFSHAEGDFTEASGDFSHAEGNFTVASGDFSHAEGDFTKATRTGSHAEGRYTLASGEVSHAEGNNTLASGNFSHAEGGYTEAGGNFSHAEGNFTVANNLSEHAQGRYNASHRASGSSWGNAGSTLSSTGFGMSDSTRRNAVETMQDGKTYIYGLGNYDGTNPTGAGVQDLASAINAKADENQLGTVYEYATSGVRLDNYGSNGTELYFRPRAFGMRAGDKIESITLHTSASTANTSSIVYARLVKYDSASSMTTVAVSSGITISATDADIKFTFDNPPAVSGPNQYYRVELTTSSSSTVGASPITAQLRVYYENDTVRKPDCYFSNSMVVPLMSIRYMGVGNPVILNTDNCIGSGAVTYHTGSSLNIQGEFKVLTNGTVTVQTWDQIRLSSGQTLPEFISEAISATSGNIVLNAVGYSGQENAVPVEMVYMDKSSITNAVNDISGANSSNVLLMSAPLSSIDGVELPQEIPE